MKKVLALLILSIVSLPLIAGRKEGLITEFRSAEEALRNKQTGPEARLKTLETNLLNAIKLSVNRHFYENKDAMLKDLKAGAFDYENPTSPVIYYVKYKNLLLRFDFPRNPELFVQAPHYEKFLDTTDIDMSHKENAAQPTKPAETPAGQPAQPVK